MRTARFPKDPGKVLTKALQMGLTSTAYLARSRVTKTTRHLYWGGKGRKGIRRILNEGLTAYQVSVRHRRPNARHLQVIENNIRRNYNKIILNTAVAYGNIEEKRRRRDEDRKYLNTLADYFGAKIRNMSASRFPFPVPPKIHTADGTTRRGYPGNSRIPEYVPRHVAPELDFVDMIRSHGSELARQCMRYSVPMREAKRYLDRLIDYLIPYLEYVYTEGQTGEKGFIYGGMRELRKIIDEIRIHYRGVNGRPQSITGEIAEKVFAQRGGVTQEDSEISESDRTEQVSDDDEREYSDLETIDEEGIDRFFDHILAGCDTNTNPHWKVHMEKTRALVKQRILTRDDAKHILNLMLEDSRKRGAAFHDFIANSEFTIRPFSLLGPIRHGDELVTDNPELLFTCETSVADGRGRIDILVFRRKYLKRVDESPATIIWEPCILIEIKTKSFYGLDLYAIPTRSRDTKKRVVEPVLEKRRSEKSEWREIIESTPDKYAKNQLEAYERVILSEYGQYVRNDIDPPKCLMKGVLVADLAESWEVLRDNIKNLILQAYHASQEPTLSERQHFHPILRGKEVRLGLVMFSDFEERTSKPLENTIEFNPFSRSRNRDDDRNFILYLTVSGKGSPSISAAEIASKCHGLKLIQGRTKNKHRDILWLDFSGEYINHKLRKQNLRLSLQSKSIQQLVREKIVFVDLSGEVSSYLHKRESIEELGQKIEENIEGKRKPFIIVTGFDKIRENVPRRKISLLDGLMTWFIEQVPPQSAALCFDRPVPTNHTSQEYDVRSIAPFYTSSPWMQVVDEIVYNTPMAPRRYGSYVPVEDDVRWIVTEKKSSLFYDTEVIPSLYMWGERFRPDSNREDNIDRQQVYYLRSTYSSGRQRNLVQYGEEEFSSVLELIPHLNRFYEMRDFTNSEENSDNQEVNILQEKLVGAPLSSPLFLTRIIFTPNQVSTSVDKDGRVKRLMSLSAINSAREYRQTRLLSEPKKQTTNPPHIGLLRFHSADTITIVRREISGLKQTIRAIEKRHSRNEDWIEFLKSLKSFLKSDLREYYNQDNALNAQRDIRVFLETNKLSKEIWMKLKPYRSHIPNGLGGEEQEVLENRLYREPDLLLLVGNHLFVLLLVSLYEAKALDLSTGFTEMLWEYLIPFQLRTIGYAPEYHSHHNTGKSILHRGKLMTRLASWAENLKKVQTSENVSEIFFGKACLARSTKSGPFSHILLAFQTTIGSREMRVAFLKMQLEYDDSVHEILRRLCQDRPFWGASDLLLLKGLAENIDLTESIDIMVTIQNGTQGLWVYNSATHKWIPIGELEYYSRKQETVTLLTSVTLREDTTLQEIACKSIRETPTHLRESIDISLQIISAVFRSILPVKCHVSLDYNEKMFRLSLVKGKNKRKVGELLIKRTADILEILRRPDVLCEPVIINSKQCVWNRFDDIEYDDDVKILQPFVIRKNPFKIDSLVLPQTADDFCSIKKGSMLRFKIQHDSYICPLRSISLEDISQQSEEQVQIVNHLRMIDGQRGQPELLSNESIHRHGTCWKLSFDSRVTLPKQISDLEKIRFGGPALATLLETGVLAYSDSTGNWISHEIIIPESNNLPKEFRESIHLVRWRKDSAVYPGRSLLDSWIPEIAIYRDRIDFKVISKLGLREKMYSIFEPNAEMLEKGRLKSLLRKGMKRVLEIGGFSESSAMKRLGDDEIASHLSSLEDDKGTRLQYDSVQIEAGLSKVDVVVANFITRDGDYVTIPMTQRLSIYKDWTIMAGGIEVDFIQNEVSTRLEGRNIDAKLVQKIAEEVIQLLEESGVVFFES
ncbi:hypothetical protein EU527_17605 [Candidatus Thorarchaeota archaeon]|nr:MAG: hypothetical protein EU527_17605 [Candidatus Thorarchaeota archaeon]